ncbi:hypothetical protein PM082_016919 [Marasmius tenuissimus]|nr:hypothetical protein PM082_016919 [Marasmius tenuissimus]
MFNHSKSSRILVSKGTLSFNVVRGSQHNYYTQSSQDQYSFSSGEEWKQEIYREYQRTPRGQIKLTETLFETETQTGQHYEDLINGSNISETKRVFYLARTMSRTRESSPFLVVKYTGRDAKKAFETDVLKFAQLKQIRDPVFPQLRGFNDSDIPMVIFQDSLIPARHAMEYTQNSAAMLCYLRLQRDQIALTLPFSTAQIIGLPQGILGDFDIWPIAPWNQHRYRSRGILTGVLVLALFSVASQRVQRCHTSRLLVAEWRGRVYPFSIIGNGTRCD